MKRVIKVDLDSREALFETYDKEKVNKELIRYLVDSAAKFRKDDEIEIRINNLFDKSVECIPLIKKALAEEDTSNERKHYLIEIKQIAFFICGILALVISTFIATEILKEIVLIGAWVLIWDMVEMEIVDDVSNRKRNKILDKLLSSSFVEQ